MQDRALRGERLAEGLEAVCFGVLLGWTTVCYAIRLLGAHAVYLVWADRALMRSSLPWTSLPQAGAELSYDDGARVPGGGLYTLVKLVQQVDDHPMTVFRAMTLLDLGAAALLFLWLRRVWGALPAMFATALYATSFLALDTCGQLWNPGFVPLFMMVAWWAWGRTAETGDASALVLVAAGSVFAAQLHLSALGAGMLLGLVALSWRPAGVRRALLASAAIAVLLYAPYLVEEASRGWSNTRMLLHPSQVGGVVAGHLQAVEGVGAKLMRALATLGRNPTYSVDYDAGLSVARIADALWELAAATHALVVLGAAPAVWWGYRRGWVGRTELRVTVGATVVVLSALALWGTEDRVQFQAQGSSRYLVALAPALPVMGAGLMAMLLAMVRAGVARMAAAACVVALTVGVSGRGAALVGQTLVQAHGWQTIPHLELLLTRLQGQTGRPLGEVVASTVVAEASEGGWVWRSSQGASDWLRRADARWEGSQPGPCALVLSGFPGERGLSSVDGAYVEGVLGQTVPAIQVRSVETFKAWVVVLYDREGPCHSVFSNRYVLSDRERQVRTVWRQMRPGSARVLPAEDDTVRVGVLLPDHSSMPLVERGILVGLDLRVVGAQLHATLWGNHLRGHAFNDGYFANVLVGAPRLVLTDAAGAEHTIDWDVDLVGSVGAVGPLRATVPLPSRPWTARFEADVMPWDAEARPGVRFDQLDRERHVVALEGVSLGR